jgi:hypothetical protein
MFKVKVTNETGCSGFSNIIVIANLGISNAEKESQLFDIYPNPAKDNIVLQLDKELIYKNPIQYRIFNMEGILLKQGFLYQKEKNHSISLRNLPEGTYLLNLSDEVGLKESMLFMKE